MLVISNLVNKNLLFDFKIPYICLVDNSNYANGIPIRNRFCRLKTAL